MKRLLVVVFAVPPTPGPSPGRAWHLARHLPALGWEAVVLTPRHPRRHFAVEKTREHQGFPIPLRRVSDPAGHAYWLQETEYGDPAASKRKPGRRPDDGLALPGLYGKEILTPDEVALEVPPARTNWLRDPLAAFRASPDARAGWIRPALEAARAVCETLRPEAVYSISPPVSAHAIAGQIAARAGIPWVADLREPWAGAPARWLDRMNRARILRTAASISLPPSYDPLDIRRRDAGAAETLSSYDLAAANGSPVTPGVLPAPGQAPSDAGTADMAGARIPVLVHAGPTAPRGRDPIHLIEAVRILAESDADRRLGFRVRMLGARDPRVARAVGEQSLGRIITIEPTVPWIVSMETQAEADALLLLLGPDEMDRLPDRLLEAMSAGRPVFALGPRGSRTERLIREAALGSYHADGASLAEGIGRWLREGARTSVAHAGDATTPYRAERVAARLAEALEKELQSRA